MFFQLNEILWEKERKKYCVYCVMRLGFYFCVFDWRTVFYVKVASAVNFVFFSSSILTCMHTWRTEIHLIKINITRWIMKSRPNTWWNLATGDIPKNMDCAKLMRVRFTIDSDWRRMIVWIYRVQNTNTNVHLI